ncbi:Uncharacterised protein [Mycobacteroides abscessus subsp. bolletii]|uniref:hypothetical protein n=1 Tax=Mycobacteroides abscessus TaxID=36809 RepID=UPI0009A66A9F|nr:hypothetical protein [Mycobacteroides abscessus]SLD51610.1 Uncharacterised protein [Mycobacteroides abscessus subsp. bolletii]
MSNSQPTVRDEARQRRRLSLDQAIDDVSNYFGVEGAVVVVINDEEFEIRARVMLDKEQQKRYLAYQERFEGLDKEDVPRRNLLTGEILVHPKTGEVDMISRVKTPHAINDVALDEPYENGLALVLWGEEKGGRYLAAGGPIGLITMMWSRMDYEFDQWKKEREKTDPKSDGGAPSVADVQPGNSV